MHGSCVCEARNLVCDVPPMKGSMNLSGPLPGTAPSTARVCVERCSLRCVLSPLVFALFAHRIARVFKGPRMDALASQSVIYTPSLRALDARSGPHAIRITIRISDYVRILHRNQIHCECLASLFCLCLKRGRFRCPGAPPEPRSAQHQKHQRTSSRVLRSECRLASLSWATQLLLE